MRWASASMLAVGGYVRRRLAERTTWLGLAVGVITVTGFWLYREQVTAAAASVLAGLIVALPDRILKTSLFESFFAPAAGSAAKPIEATPQKVATMSVTSTLAEVLQEAPDFIKVLQDGVTIANAIKAGDLVAVVTNAAGYEADVVRVFNDIKALGAAQAAVTAPV